MRRFLSVLHTRNLEFFRDRAALGWNLVFPILLVVGFALAFSGDGRPRYKIGLIEAPAASTQATFFQLRHVEFVPYQNPEVAVEKLRLHQLALLVDPDRQRYWVNESSPDGYFAEQLLLGRGGATYERTPINGREIRYVDWVLPGILGMNMMFSALFGVGYVIVRYRKNGVLKRLKATPLTAVEFLAAQIVSRLFIILSVSSGLYLGCAWFIDFPMHGAYLHLLLVAALGAMSLIALGLLIAARSRSEELAGGLLNMISWPMMFLSGVWFSLEGSPQWMQNLAQALPLTHALTAARAVMIEGAGLAQIMPDLLTLLAMSLGFLLVGAWAFSWDEHP